MPQQVQGYSQQTSSEPSRASARRGQLGERERADRAQGAASVWSTIATALGWFSIGLGLAELLAPRTLARGIGARDKHSQLVRALGAREFVVGVGILLGRNTRRWVQSRVAGDMMDLSLLGVAYRDRRAVRGRLAAATATVAGVTALDVMCSTQLGRPTPFIVAKRVAILRPADDLYRYWRQLENLPQVLGYLEGVTQYDDKRSHWIAKAPLGKKLEWDALITEDIPGQKLAWRSTAPASVENRGEVEFVPLTSGRGTAVQLTMTFNPPGGPVGIAFGELFRMIPETQIGQALRRFKQLMETGEIATTEGQPSGRRSAISTFLP